MWFLDDGSLHKVKNFYNLCTHSFSLEDNILIKDKLNFKFGTDFRITSELKKDGRKFYYLSIRKIGGANIISDILSKYPIESMKYKLWSSETIHEWSTLQEKWKSQDSNLINFEKFAKSFYLRMGHSKNKKIKLIG